MPPLLQYIIKRLLAIIITLLVITSILYGVIMLTPPETRATLYMPKGGKMTEEQYANMIQLIIRRKHLADPYPVQYYYYLSSLVEGNWGYSPVLQKDVLSAINEKAPVTAELTLYSILVFIPLGLISGVMAGSKPGHTADNSFRLAAFIAATFPSFILALILMSIFYIQLYWFAPERLSTNLNILVNSDKFIKYSGLLTLDGLLNGRPDVSLDALRHLVMPVFTLAISHWSTLGRITRISMMTELQKEYITAAKARGIPAQRITWRHALRNAIPPALTNSMLSAAALISGVFVVEVIFNLHGISEIAVKGMQYVPDAPAALGFAIYSVIIVLLLMSSLDLVLYALDPRIRKGL
jgi:ABC-type dipeptide/oligopeptide/nickel transport system permease component